MTTKRSNFMFTNLFSTDLSSNRALFKSIYNSIETTGTNIGMVVNPLNKLGNSIMYNTFDMMYKTIEHATNVRFFHNTVMIGITNNEEEPPNLVSKDNYYYLLISGEPKQQIKEDLYIDISAKELLNQIDTYTQAHKNNIVFGLEEVLKYTTGNFSLLLYDAPTNSAYFFTSNKTIYVHHDDNSVYVYTAPPKSTDLQISSSTQIDDRTIYSFNSNGKYIFKQYKVYDPISKGNRYDLVMNYDNSIESFILPFVVKDIYSPNKIEINANLTTDDEYLRIKYMFSNFEVSTMPLAKGQLLFNHASNYPINYIDFINDFIEIEKSEKIVSIQNGSRYIPVFKNLQDYEILLLGLKLNVPFRMYNSKCEHTTVDKFGNYTLCGECDECKELYKKFAQLGYTLDNIPINFAHHSELDKLKINKLIVTDMNKLDEEWYMNLRSKLVEVFPNDSI